MLKANLLLLASPKLPTLQVYKTTILWILRHTYIPLGVVKPGQCVYNKFSFWIQFLKENKKKFKYLSCDQLMHSVKGM